MRYKNYKNSIKAKVSKVTGALPIYLFTLIPLLTACTDLDQTAQSSIDKDNFYQSEADLQAAVNGVYEILSDNALAGEMHGVYNNELIYFNELQSEYARRGTANSADIAEIGNFAITPTNAFVESTWLVHYTGINRANILIDKAEASSKFSDAVKRSYVGQAKFLRALFYFDLVRFYGDVPLVLHDGEGEGAARTASDEVYRQIVADLEDAEQIPAGTSALTSIASSGAATALLAKVYLFWAQIDTDYSLAHQSELYQKAVDYADKSIRSGQYRLIDKFIDNWSLDKQDGPELIFTVEHKFGNNRNVTGHCVFSTGFTNSKLPVIAALSNEMYDNFDPADQRRDASLTKRLWNPDTQSYFDFDRLRYRKYIDTLYMANYSAPYISGQNTSSSVLRYAEVLLIKAEAENELNGPTTAAYDAINQVRRRAYYSPYSLQQNQPTDGTTLDLSGLTKDEFREALHAERYKEFITEGTRWFDLKRWHILVKTIKERVPADDLKYQNISPKHYYLPIPSKQITLNPNLEQNWGYAGNTAGTDPYTAKGWQ